MARILVGRASFTILALLLVSLALFVLTRAIPESPARTAVGLDATPAQVHQWEHDHGIDRPVIVQYVDWLRALIFHGDLGTSPVTGLSMNEQLARTLPVTLELVVVAFGFALIVSLALGIVSALYEGTVIDHAARVFGIVGVSVPGFWLGLVLILVFAVQLSWLPAGGIVPPTAGVLPHVKSLILPAFCLAAFYMAVLSRMTRSSLIEVLSQDYIRTARALGLGRGLILLYALKNALVPVVTVAAMSFGYMFGWALVIEHVFNIQGMSNALLTAISQRDYTLVQAVVFVFTLIFLAANLIADLMNAWLNPRLGAEPA